ncbi:RDD family protein [Mycobacterium talmoniae]|uniref:RDD domain-containing protein n=1 Tax=Mycobacterium talmoniae TaxID=1858794 RepID=A0A1S1NKU4_9MYCO|nr:MULTISPECIES: RDD family protein [Mycobacterium]OHV03406.1 hypothetical protein BKN37_15105 [Mycobacterium talmoniae]TDH49052.1 RDD family protein [Mycobacterium eburneum]
MARTISSWLSGPGSAEPGPPTGYPGERLGLPEHGPGSLAPLGRRLLALLADWLLAYGLAGLGLAFGVVTPTGLPLAVLVVWLILGAVSVRLFSFTPGQLVCGLQVASVDQRGVGIGRAAVRGALIALVIPALFVNADGRGFQDQVTHTAVVRR